MGLGLRGLGLGFRGLVAYHSMHLLQRGGQPQKGFVVENCPLKPKSLDGCTHFSLFLSVPFLTVWGLGFGVSGLGFRVLG